MRIKDKETSYLITLLSAALKGEKAPAVPEGLDYCAFFSIAKSQQIYNIVFPLLTDSDFLPSEEKAQWNNYSKTELVRTIAVNHDRELIIKKLQDNDIDFMFLKGLVIRDYYPKSSMRQMSDNDILYDETKRETLMKIMKSLGYKLETCCENSDDFFKKPYYTFEFHRNLFFEEHDFCPRFDNVWEHSTKDETEKNKYNIGINDNFLFTVAHMYKHYSTYGCGIRFLADVYLLIKKDSDKLDSDYINSKFSEMGIGDFAAKAIELSKVMIDKNDYTSEEMDFLMTFLKGGVYGSSDKYFLERYNEYLKSTHTNTNGGFMASFLFRRIFPKKEKMYRNYPYLEKHRYLLLFFYIRRLFEKSGNSKKALNEVKAIGKISKEDK